MLLESFIFVLICCYDYPKSPFLSFSFEKWAPACCVQIIMNKIGPVYLPQRSGDHLSQSKKSRRKRRGPRRKSVGYTLYLAGNEEDYQRKKILLETRLSQIGHDIIINFKILEEEMPPMRINRLDILYVGELHLLAKHQSDTISEKVYDYLLANTYFMIIFWQTIRHLLYDNLWTNHESLFGRKFM